MAQFGGKVESKNFYKIFCIRKFYFLRLSGGRFSAFSKFSKNFRKFQKTCQGTENFRGPRKREFLGAENFRFPGKFFEIFFFFEIFRKFSAEKFLKFSNFFSKFLKNFWTAQPKIFHFCEKCGLLCKLVQVQKLAKTNCRLGPAPPNNIWRGRSKFL